MVRECSTCAVWNSAPTSAIVENGYQGIRTFNEMTPKATSAIPRMRYHRVQDPKYQLRNCSVPMIWSATFGQFWYRPVTVRPCSTVRHHQSANGWRYQRAKPPKRAQRPPQSATLAAIQPTASALSASTAPMVSIATATPTSTIVQLFILRILNLFRFSTGLRANKSLAKRVAPIEHVTIGTTPLRNCGIIAQKHPHVNL